MSARLSLLATAVALAAPVDAATADTPSTSTEAVARPVSPAVGVVGIPAPVPAETPPAPRSRFTIDPVGDGAILSVSLGFSLLGELVIGTGEIQPQQPTGQEHLLGIDRPAIAYGSHSESALYSDIGVGAVGAYCLADSLLTGHRTDPEAGFVDGVIYGETAVLTWAMTDLVKVAVRRPRPQAYRDVARHKSDPTYRISKTDNALSFFSGHTAETAALSSAATYLAFARDPGGMRPWLTLGAGALATSFVGWQRVRSGSHFPTDVIAGAMAGAGMGVLVPHFHREATVKERPVWLGMAATPDGQRLAALTGEF